MSKRVVAAVLCCLSGLLCLASSATAQEVFRWKFQEGDQFDLQLSQEMRSEMETQGNEYSTSMQAEMQLRWRVASVDDEGGAQIVQSIERAVLELAMPEEKPIKIDTDSDEEQEGIAAEILAQLAPLLGQEVTLQVTARGELQAMTLSEEFQQALDDLGGGNPVSEQMLRETFGQCFFTLPAEAIAEGAAWDHQYTITTTPPGLSVTMHIVYAGQEQAEDRSVAVFDVTAETALLEPGEDEPQPPFQAKLNEQSAVGYMWFDQEAGRLIESSLAQQLDMDLTFGGLTVNSQIEIKSRYELIPVAAASASAE